MTKLTRFLNYTISSKKLVYKAKIYGDSHHLITKMNIKKNLQTHFVEFK